MKAFLFLIPVLFCGAVRAHTAHHPPGAAHLVFDGGRVHAHIEWLVGPAVDKDSALKLQWMNGRTHRPMAAPGEFDVELFMPSMGHGSAKTVIRQLSDAEGQPALGLYEVSQMLFFMGGEWEVRVHLKSAEGITETQTIELNLGEH